MAKIVSVPVPGGLMVHGAVLKAVTLREPSFDDVLELGDPIIWTKAPDGSLFAIENGGAIKGYLERCLVEPKDTLLLEPGGFRLALEIKAAILGFFRDDVSETAPSSTSQTTSSSSADSAQTPSAS